MNWTYFLLLQETKHRPVGSSKFKDIQKNSFKITWKPNLDIIAMDIYLMRLSQEFQETQVYCKKRILCNKYVASNILYRTFVLKSNWSSSSYHNLDLL